MRQPLNDQKEAPSGMRAFKIHPLIWLVAAVFIGWGAIAISQWDYSRKAPSGMTMPQADANADAPMKEPASKK